MFLFFQVISIKLNVNTGGILFTKSFEEKCGGANMRKNFC